MPTKKPLIGAAIVGQSGGPSSVINASAYGVIKTALEDENITKVYGAEHGIVGVLEDRLMIMDEEDPAELERLLYTPSSALGSCRYKIADPSDNDKDYKRILEIFEKYNVRYFFYIGGNDSMDTCAKISRYMAKVGYECRVIGVPKTIDNDLIGTDHCPGFASAAKYIATSVMEVARDCRVYNKGMITIIECMGRHAGWLTAATVLPAAKGDGPDLIYLPEVDFDMADFLDDVIRVYEGQGQCLVAVSEGIHYSDGAFVSEAKTSSTDGFGHAQLGGLAHRLAGIVSAATGAKVRGIELPEATGRRANPETKKELYDEGHDGWYDADTVAASIGQSENRFTPLQLCSYTAALANRGVRYKATLLKRVLSSDYQELVLENQPVVASTLNISDEAYAAYSEGMREAVTSGTAYSAFVGYDVAVCAKTGTAQHGSGGSDNASFVLYAPADDPEIAIAIYVEKGAQGGTLGTIARDILTAYFSEAGSTDTVPAENTLN